MKLKNRIKVAIDSPAAAGAGTQAKLISKHFNLFYLDTGKIYRLIANIKMIKQFTLTFKVSCGLVVGQVHQTHGAPNSIEITYKKHN